MNYLLIHPELLPTKYLGFIDPDDFYSYNGILQENGETRPYNSIQELMDHINSRRKSLNFIKIQYLSEKIQNYLYLIGDIPHTLFIRADESHFPRTVVGDIEVASRLAYSLSRAAITGFFSAGSSGWATKTEATRRAATCIQCPENKKLRKSKLTRFNDRIASLFTLARSTPYDTELNDCGICGCPLHIKVHYSPDVIRDTTKHPAEAFPEDFIGKDKRRHICWARQILEGKESK